MTPTRPSHPPDRTPKPTARGRGGGDSAAPLNIDQRAESLSRLVPLWPSEARDVSIAGRRRVIQVMEKALRAERRRGASAHWCYDLARHAALYRAWRRERDALQRLSRGSNME